MRDVADKVGVSKALVSLVFRNAAGPSAETRARVLAAAEELGYRVNRTAALMTARRSHHIGLTINIRNSFHTEIAESIVAAADRAGYEVVLGAVTPTHGEAQVIDTLLDFRCEGLLLLGPELSTEALTTLGKQLPSVVIGRRMRANTLDVVRTADAVASEPWWITSSVSATVAFCSSPAGPVSSPPIAETATCVRCTDTAWAIRALSSRETSPSPRESLRHNRCLPICRQPWCAPTTASQSALSMRCVAPELTCPERYQ